MENRKAPITLNEGILTLRGLLLIHLLMDAPFRAPGGAPRAFVKEREELQRGSPAWKLRLKKRALGRVGR